jgi:dihydroorotase, multifunctional complex type
MILIKNATIVNEGTRFVGSVLIDQERIHKIIRGKYSKDNNIKGVNLNQIIDAEGLLLLPGMIDDQVHFREPGLTHKADIHSESKAAIAGGITSFMDMPNTIPQTISIDALNDKFNRAQASSLANYSFFLGATNNNLEELKRPEAQRAAAIKVFMGSSTGNMLVDNQETLEHIFSEVNKPIAVHAESETIIQENKNRYIKEYGEDLDIHFHSKIRSAEACYTSSSEAVRLAKKNNTRLHLFHLSTEKEMTLLEAKPINEKRITGEVTVQHLWFTDKDYATLGNKIKWNPAIKSKNDREALRKALIEGKIDVIATDHAPHTWEEKQGSCLKAASGGPMVQHALVALLELCHQGVFTEELIVEKTAHNPSELFQLKDRGYIKEGFYADLVLIRPDNPWEVEKDNLLYKCAWSPFEGITFNHKIEKTFVNGTLVYDQKIINENYRGKELCFR